MLRRALRLIATKPCTIARLARCGKTAHSRRRGMPSAAGLPRAASAPPMAAVITIQPWSRPGSWGVCVSCRRQPSLRVGMAAAKGAARRGYALLLLGVAAWHRLGGLRRRSRLSAPRAPLPEAFIAASQRPAADRRDHHVVDTATWWRSLHDRQLDALIERAIAASPTLEVALDRLQQARAQEAVVYRRGIAGRGASEGGGARHRQRYLRADGLSQTLVSGENTSGLKQINNVAGFDAAWEIDFFGKFRRADRGGAIRRGSGHRRPQHRAGFARSPT